MTTPCVTISSQELLSLSPEIRSRVRDIVTAKRINEAGVSTNIFEATIEDESDPLPCMPDGLTSTDPVETYLNSLAPSQIPGPFIVAKESHSLRSIVMDIDNATAVECVIDPGSQIIAISEEICHDMGLLYDPTITLHMQSANGEIDKSLGLAHNVPCRLGSVTLYLQIHVIRSPAYDILLGRPFDVLTESTVKNYHNEDQTITITDPNSNRTVTVPTIARGQHRHRQEKSTGFRTSMN
jgi:hypothetical protein